MKYGGITPMEVIVAVKGKALGDITILKNVSFVMKGEVVYKQVAD